MNLTAKQIIFIAGGGKYGSQATRYLLEKPNLTIVVCDENRNCEASPLVKTIVESKDLRSPIETKTPTLLIGDATQVLVRFFSNEILPKLIVPCVPFHFAAKVLTAYLTGKGLKVQPHFQLLKLLFDRARLGEVEYRLSQDNALGVASKMPFDMQCVSGCTQPGKCPATGRRLLKPMYKLMTEALGSEGLGVAKVLRSRLLGPNVGGFSAEELKQTLDLCFEIAPCAAALATSCSCHAVANVFSIGC